MNLQEWREKRAAAAAKMEALFPRNEAGEVSYDGEWTDEHQAKYTAAKAQWDAADGAIAALDDVAERYRTLDAADAAARHEAEGSGVSLDEAQTALAVQLDAFCAFARRGPAGLTDEQRALFRADADGRPRADINVGTNADGGFAVPTLVADMLVSKINEHSGVLEVADVRMSDTGRQVNHTTIDWTDAKWRAKIVAEGAAPDGQTPAFGQVALKFDVYKSPLVAISDEFLMDTAVEGIIEELDDKLLYSVGWGVNYAFTQAAPADEGNAVGFLADAGVSGLSASAGQVKALDLAKLRHKVNRRYRRNGRGVWMFNDDVMLDLIAQEDGEGRPLWLPSTREGAPDRIYGHPFIVNDDMDDNVDDKKPVVFGDFSQFKVRIATGESFGPRLRRFSGDVYGPKNQVAFNVSARYAGRLVNSDAVKSMAGDTA